MKRNLKALGLLAFAALAMSAMFAASASAEGQLGTFTAGDATPTVKHTTTEILAKQYGGKEVNFFEAFEEKITCEDAGVTNRGTTQTGTEFQIKITSTYKDCLAGARPATVTVNGCEYLFTRPTTIAPLGTGKYTGKADLTCPKGNNIKIEVFQFGSMTSHSFKVCTLEILTTGGEEEGGHVYYPLAGHVVYQNSENPNTKKHDITTQATVEGITVVESGLCGSGEDKEGIFSSKVTVEGYEDLEHTTLGNPLDVWLSHGEE